jgi:murein DD-endopeptidase MepM/ murein hydrolase activator NlpD
VDITGYSVHSATNGTVYQIPKEESESYGWWIEIKADDGSIWKYAHLLEKPSLEGGTRVYAGKTVIGKANHTGDCYGGHNGAHLHLECRVDGLPVDPLEKLQNGCFLL